MFPLSEAFGKVGDFTLRSSNDQTSIPIPQIPRLLSICKVFFLFRVNLKL